MKLNFFYLLALLSLASCSPRNLAYFSNMQEQGTYEEKVLNDTEPTIQAYDLLSITVSSLSREANAIFNTGEFIPAGSINDYSMTRNAAGTLAREGYLVNKDGFVNFPLLGKVEVAGLTKDEATEKFTTLLRKHLKEPIVNIRYLNYKVTVVGEVNRPATFTVPSERINIIEALGMAGDMTAYGKRENVLVLREEAGSRKMTRLNLNDKDILNSPYFYLQQNDVVYVEPDRMKQVQASTNTRTISIIASVTSLLIVLATRIF
ncbi:polysaccharide biosynthesis/export family protein [Pontibacter sp. 172403-2]|uniref:polysaccharide biosynthesis/export family protein n=1 Tax=Pontibacter rufus TaxID=2791028 RepID=UPI0018AF7949|nr:polysaccharide biosynthesis/export family protein [Pontibacter sp. 172403-2]MBF9253258.1 polysaccharide biosynthesis/export family protein [Pontibacter sp. 172403-2]